MTYQPKVVRCRLKTGGKSIEEIRVQYAGQGLTYRDFENIQRANEHFDGLVILLSLWDYDNGEYYHMYSWEKTDDEKMMMGIYYAEQTHPVPRYKDDFEGFRSDWTKGEYDPGSAFIFHRQDVEELEVISEEVKRQENPPPSPPPHSGRRKKKRKGRRKK